MSEQYAEPAPSHATAASYVGSSGRSGKTCASNSATGTNIAAFARSATREEIEVASQD